MTFDLSRNFFKNFFPSLLSVHASKKLSLPRPCMYTVHMPRNDGMHENLTARRAALLRKLLPVVMGLLAISLVLVLLVNERGSSHRIAYGGLISALLIICGTGYVFLLAGKYLFAAICTIVVGIAGPWGSLLLDPRVGLQDLFPLVYVTVPVLLASTFLPLVPTVVLAIVQLVILVFVALQSPAFHHMNWASLFAYVTIVSVIGITMNHLNNIAMKQLQESAIHDYLTGLFNRRYFEQTLDHKISRGNRTTRTIGLITFDIDRFKQYNDTYGHAAGDEVLKAIGNLLFERLELTTIACRLGGDEFAIIIPGAGEDETCNIARELGTAIKTLPVIHRNQNLETVTISQGVAIFPRDGTHTAELLSHADVALLRSKQDGRDRVTCYASSLH